MDISKLPIMIADPASKAETYIKKYHDEYDKSFVNVGINHCSTNDKANYSRTLEINCPEEVDLHHLDAIGGMGKLLLFIKSNPGMTYFGITHACSGDEKLTYDQKTSKNSCSKYWFRKVDEGVYRQAGQTFYRDLIERAIIGKMIKERRINISKISLSYEKVLYITELGTQVLQQNGLID